MDKTELRIVAMDYAVTLCQPGKSYTTLTASGLQEDVIDTANRILFFLSADEPKEE